MSHLGVFHPQEIQAIKNNSNLSGPDKSKLIRLESFKSNGILYRAGLYNQYDKIAGEPFFHYRINAEKDGQEIPLIDFRDIQDFLGKKHPFITFIQVFPAESDIVDEGNTYHFFGFFPYAKTTKDIINAPSTGAVDLHTKELIGFQNIQTEKARLGFMSNAGFQFMSSTNKRVKKLIEDPIHIFIPTDHVRLPNLKEIRTFSH